MLLSQICSELESLAPLSYQEDYDNSGLIVGNLNQVIHKAIICLDCIEEVVDEAINKGANLIIAHHPIIFKGLKRFNNSNYIEKTIYKAIKNDIAIYAIHTNLDSVLDGVNGILANKLGIINTSILQPKQNLLKKLVTFVPQNNLEQVRTALFNAGAGNIGNYSDCSFSSEGYGTFKANDKANPYVGDKNKLHKEQEVRLEVVFKTFLQKKIISELIKSHPYEEVAYDIFNISGGINNVGSGIIGNLKEPIEAEKFISIIKQALNIKHLKHTKLVNKTISSVAICGGSGSFLIKEAKAQKADIFITGDIKYHDFFDAEDNLIIVDAGHFETEQFTIELLFNFISKKFPTFAVLQTAVNTNPVCYS